jgi:hypothetical protein
MARASTPRRRRYGLPEHGSAASGADVPVGKSLFSRTTSLRRTRAPQRWPAVLVARWRVRERRPAWVFNGFASSIASRIVSTTPGYPSRAPTPDIALHPAGIFARHSRPGLRAFAIVIVGDGLAAVFAAPRRRRGTTPSPQQEHSIVIPIAAPPPRPCLRERLDSPGSPAPNGHPRST